MAEPSPARPTAMLPLTSPNIGINMIFTFRCSAAPAIEHGRTAEIV